MESAESRLIKEFKTEASPILSEQEQKAIEAARTLEHFKKGEIIIREGEIFNRCFYVIEGCVRQFHLKDGEEITTEFFMEGDSFSAIGSVGQRTPSPYTFECNEDTSFSVVTDEQEIKLYTLFPRFQAMCRLATEERLAKFQQDFAKFISSSPEERYTNILNSRPDLISRVPQYQLASYLGVTPESLSRIRKRLHQKRKQ